MNLPEKWNGLAAHETRFALRRLFRHPTFWLPAVLTLALGVGSVVSAFTVLDAVVLRPLPYPEADRLVRLQSAVPETGGPSWGLAKSEFLYFQRAGGASFESLGLYLIDRATVVRGEMAEQVYTASVSDGVAGVLGVRPLLGRAPSARDSRAQAPPLVWLSHGFWTRSFGRDTTVVGRTLVVDGHPVQVAGVLPPSARLPEELQIRDIRVDLWAPLRLDPADPPSASHRFRALGRLRPEVSAAAARADLTRMTAQLSSAFPEIYTAAFLHETGFSTELLPLRNDVLGDEARTLWILFGAVALLLVVAYANVASLVLAQAEAEQQELALRAALGASRRRLALHSLAEAWPLVLIVGSLAFCISLAAVRLLLAFPPGDLPRLAEVRFGWREVALTLFLSAVGGAVHALLPLVRRNLGSELLTTSCRGMTQSRRQRFARDVIVVAQVALSLILVAGAVLLFRSFRHLSAVEPGFSQNALTFHVVLPRSRYDSLPSAASFYRRLAAKTESLQDVHSAGMTTALPLTGFDGCSSVYLEDRPLGVGEQPPCVPVFMVSPGYFQALGIQVQGKTPEWADLEGRAAIAVVSRALARRLWPQEEMPAGKGVQVSPGGTPYRVIGVAGDVRANGLSQPPVEALYLPLIPAAGDKSRPPVLDLAVVARTSGEPSRIVPAVRRAVRELDSGVPVTEVRSVQELLRGSMARTSFSALLLAVSSGLAMVFAGLGIYSLLAFIIARRQREIGIRIALGAGRRRVGWLVLRQSLQLTLAGVALGLLGASYGADLLKSLLFEVDPADPVTLGIAAAFLVLIAGFAAWVPAWKAAHVQPREALHLQ